MFVIESWELTRAKNSKFQNCLLESTRNMEIQNKIQG